MNKAPVQDAAAPGRFRYLDADRNDTINSDDRVHFGNPNPQFTAGINIGFNYKSFDFSAFFYGSFGNDVMNIQKTQTDFFQWGSTSIQYISTKSKALLYDSWTPQHTNSTVPFSRP